jgi:anaerobic selenocysteine-containing dehydrogenase
MEEFTTACPCNCYSTCSFRVQVENNTILRVFRNSDNLATPEGPCIKGLSYIEQSSSTQRIINPLKKSSSGGFERITLAEAFDIISEKLLKIKNETGPRSILWYRGSGMSGLTNEIGYAFWKLFGGVTITYGNLCWPAGLEAVLRTLGSVKHNVPWDIENASTVIIWGKNPAETNIQEMAFIGRVRAKGGKVIVVDPRRTTTADKADYLFRPKPGTDAAFALAVAWVLVNEKLIDYDFIRDHVSGFDEFKLNSLLEPEKAEAITGIPAKEIINLATIIGKSKPVTFIPGYGLQRYPNGGQTIRSILSLAVITGNIGKPGAGFNYANLQSYIFDDIKEPGSYYPDASRDQPFRRTISMATLGSDILSASDPEIRAIWIERGNPLLQSPDSGSVFKAFSKMEFNVVVEQFMTDTAKLADIILPAKDMFVQTDIIGSYWSPYVQLKPRILKPAGEVIPESEIYYHLAKNLKLEFNDEIIPQPGNDNIEKWLEKRIRGYSSVSLDNLRSGPVLPPDLQHIAYDDMKFDTPSGKIELFSSELAEKWNSSPYPVYTASRADESESRKYPLVLMTPNIGSRIHSQFGNLDIIRQNVETPSLQLSLKDATSRKISSGDKVRVFNSRGSISCTAKVTGRIPAGSISFPNGIWIDEGGGINSLITATKTDIGYGAVFHGSSVEVEKVSDEE